MSALAKEKHLQLYREAKARRLKKIKSKVYRSIKKKKRAKEEGTRMEMLAESDPGYAGEQASKLERERAQERLSLRHRNKTKFTQELRRFADQKDVQKLYGELNRERKKILRKMDLRDLEELASGSESGDGGEMGDEELVEELRRELESDGEGDGGEEGIVAELMRRGRENLMEEAQELVDGLQQEEGVGEVRREKFLREEKLGEEKGTKRYLKGKSAIEALREANKGEGEEYMDADTSLGKRKEEGQRETNGKLVISDPIKKKKKALGTANGGVDLKGDLLEGVQITKLKEKYQKRAGFNQQDMERFLEENEEDQYNLIGEEIHHTNEHKGEFDKEKEEDYEKDLPVEEKAMKGWGDWTGVGIAEKVVDPKIELEKKRRQIVRSVLLDGTKAKEKRRKKRKCDSE